MRYRHRVSMFIGTHSLTLYRDVHNTDRIYWKFSAREITTRTRYVLTYIYMIIYKIWFNTEKGNRISLEPS